MRFLFFLMCTFPLIAQTSFDPSQLKPCPIDKQCVLGSKAGQVQWLTIDAASMKMDRSQADPFGWTLFALSPALDALTARVTTIEGQVAALQAQQPTVEVIATTNDGETFTPSSTPRWGYINVARDGVTQSAPGDYTFTGGKVTFKPQGQIVLPLAGEIIRLEYWR